MKATLTALIAATALSVCSANPSASMGGGNRDAHNCIGSAGQSWSVLKQQCVQVWTVADLTLNDTANGSLAVYVIFSADQAQVEVFAADVPPNTLLEAVKGGYASRDGQVRLLHERGQWRIIK